MNATGAIAIISKFDEYFNEKNFACINKGGKESNEIIDEILKIILTKFPKGSKIGFDTKACTMLLILLRMLYVSANTNEYTIDSIDSNMKDKHKIGTMMYSFWAWIDGLVNQAGGYDDITTAVDDSETFEKITNTLVNRDGFNEDYCIFAQTTFMMIINTMADKMARLYSKTHEWGASGVVIKSFMLRGLWTDMNPGAANPDIFDDIQNASNAFDIVKNDWKAAAKEELKKERNIQKENKKEAKEKAKK